MAMERSETDMRGFDCGLRCAPSHPTRCPSLDLPRLFRQHDRDAVADRISELCGARDQFLPGRIEFQRALGHRADQDLQQLRIDGAVEAFGRGRSSAVSGSAWSLAYPIAPCHLTRPSAPVRRARPVAAPSARAGPIARSRETPNRGFGRGRGPLPPIIRIVSEGSRHSSAGAGRSPARRRGPRDRRLPRCGPPFPASAARRTRGAAAARAGPRLLEAASTLAMICSAATSCQRARIAA